MANEDATRIWTHGYLIFGKKTRIEVEEVSVDLSRDLKEHYNSGSAKPATLIPGNEKISFKIKRIFSNTTLMEIYQKRCSFDLLLFNNSSDPGANSTGEQICALTGCILEKNTLDGLGKGDGVSEDASGKALDITFNVKEIAPMINPACEQL